MYIMNIITKLPLDIKDIIKPYVIGYKDTITDYYNCKREIWVGPLEYWTGIFREWYPTGELWRKRNYRKGKQHGISQGWFPKGQIWYEHKYREGERHGIQQEWYNTGKLQFEFNYHKDKKHGISRGWSPTGELEYESNYYEGKLI